MKRDSSHIHRHKTNCPFYFVLSLPVTFFLLFRFTIKTSSICSVFILFRFFLFSILIFLLCSPYFFPSFSSNDTWSLCVCCHFHGKTVVRERQRKMFIAQVALERSVVRDYRWRRLQQWQLLLIVCSQCFPFIFWVFSVCYLSDL